MKIAVEGCAHGELEKIYDTIQGIEKAENIKVDLLLCCGDFQSTRNIDDLQTMAVPKKYVNMGTFYKYYSGELVAPMLTIFIGGNHESSNYLQELAYGGWVAPNIYYLGLASVVRVNGIRIAGISGIYKGYDFLRGHFEFSPYTESSMTSVYHVRQLEVFRLKQLSGEIDIFMSHDWPRGIYNYGNKEQLLRFKRHFREDVENNELGSKPCEDLLNVLKPSYWFAAHLHCKFSALVPHIDYDAAKDDNSDEEENSNESAPANNRYTKFLALDKCLPRRRFLQVLDIETPADYITEGPLRFEYDLEWLTILSLTNHLLSVKPSKNYMPGPLQESNGERYKFTPTAEELAQVRRRFNDNLEIPRNFCRTVEPYDGVADYKQCGYVPQPKAQINPQATQFCDLLSIDDPVSIAMLIGGHELSHSTSLNDSSLLADESHTSLNTTDCSNTSILQTTPLKRKSLLNLPKPSCLSESVEIGRDEEEDDVEGPLSKSNVGELGAASDVAQADADAINEDGEGLLSSKPPLKKLKRRNQNIYNVDDDADADDAEATQIET